MNELPKISLKIFAHKRSMSNSFLRAIIRFRIAFNYNQSSKLRLTKSNRANILRILRIGFCGCGKSPAIDFHSTYFIVSIRGLLYIQFQWFKIQQFNQAITQLPAQSVQKFSHSNIKIFLSVSDSQTVSIIQTTNIVDCCKRICFKSV